MVAIGLVEPGDARLAKLLAGGHAVAIGIGIGQRGSGIALHLRQCGARHQKGDRKEQRCLHAMKASKRGCGRAQGAEDATAGEKSQRRVGTVPLTVRVAPCGPVKLLE
ncbi:hypothetical protein GCM10009075_38620 [Sphingomonas trueperi]